MYNFATHTNAPARQKGREKLKRVSVYLPVSIVEELRNAQKTGGFRSLYHLLQTMVDVFLRQRNGVRHAVSEHCPRPTHAEEILEMFGQLHDAEPVPEAGAVPIVRKPRKKEYI